ncbi:MAG: hypothetical protein NC094_09885 [Bacteroidales bacterium]|nr:hypothetical protein [Lachnoclostridium sp.]MCM1383636.1 hypothetical protein [Lachnoclostridium sp.]MCM1465718.1 hypothetical protein [Bacteroidales bacterium]
MAGTMLKAGTKVYEYGQPMAALHLIASGKVAAFYPGGHYELGKGDVIGICEICSEFHFISYTVREDATVLTYPITNVEGLGDFLQNHQDIARFFLLSTFRQLNELQNLCSISHLECSNLYRELLSDCEKYNQLSSRFRIQAKPLEGMDELTAYLNDESPDLWLSEYYAGMMRIYSGSSCKEILQESAVSLGFLRKCSLDFRKTYSGTEEQHAYRTKLSKFYFKEDGNDLFERFATLAGRLGADCEEFEEVVMILERIIKDYGEDNTCDRAQTDKRIAAFRSNTEQKNVQVNERAKDASGVLETALPEELVDSLGTILDYAGVEAETEDSFRRHIEEYRKLEDKADTDEAANRLRRMLTEEFYLIYSAVFENTLDAAEIPLPVLMFLYFGYVDEELAGAGNAGILAKIAGQITDHSDLGVYTFYDWLLAVYDGNKVPSRDEFGQDYAEYLSKQKQAGNITDRQLRDLQEDGMEKVRFELKNMFPTANKITYGRVTTFCPLFVKEDVLKDLEDSYVTPSKIARSLQMIKAVDYTAFYRESLDMDNIAVMGKEPIHLEYLPDVILLPNIGIRGILWQEIEGKVRNSPSRMFLSVFHLEDLDSSMIRMTGDFRWELCKRVQGGRWNDLTEPSLTSEYFDYIQFYKKNRDLSTEAKEKLRSGLQRAKNSFKEMFIRDYMMWILFEGKNSPRMNKVARKIFFTYCPFPEDICTVLAQNPLYAELLERRRIKTAQKLHHLDVLVKKLRNSGTVVPETLEQELLYVEGKIN